MAEMDAGVRGAVALRVARVSQAAETLYPLRPFVLPGVTALAI
jgi:hypothetical protein